MIQRTIKKIFPLLATVWGLTITGCRDFEDSRTPYKPSVGIRFRRTQKDPSTTIFIRDPATDKDIAALTDSSTENSKELPLSSNVNTTQIRIVYHSTTAVSAETLELHYHKKAVLISHRCGCAHKYILDRVTFTGTGKYKIINKELSTFNESAIDLEIYL